MGIADGDRPVRIGIEGMGKLTDLQLKKALAVKHYDRKTVLRDGDGLRLQCLKGSAVWVYKYQLDGKVRELGLGPARPCAAQVTLPQARQKALAARADVKARGVDVVARDGRAAKLAETKAAQLEAAQAITVRMACDGYLKDHARKWTDPRAEKDWLAALTNFAFPLIGDASIAAVGRSDVLAVLTQEIAGETFRVAKPGQYRRVAHALHNVLEWAVARGYRPEGVNPAARTSIAAAVPVLKTAKRVNRKTLPTQDMPALWALLEANPHLAKVKALQFATLEGARGQEVLKAKWQDVDLQTAVWTVPQENHKTGSRTGRDLVVPLSAAAVKLLEGLPSNREPSAPLFPKADGTQYSVHVDQKDPLEVLIADETKRPDPHGMRSALRSWAEARGVNHKLGELLINHLTGDQTERAYARHDYLAARRHVLDGWADYLKGGAGVIDLALVNGNGG